MRASYEDIERKKGDQAFLAYRLTVPSFSFKWHYHPEYELTLITEGSGNRLVGDSYQDYTAGDLVLLGPGLPHTWVSNPGRKKPVSAIVIQFPEKFIRPFLSLTEFGDIAALLASAARGLHFSSRDLADELRKLPDLPGVEKVAALLLILQKLTAQKPDKLASVHFRAVRGDENEKRVNLVCQYLQKHAAEPIALETVASLVHLSRSAFCKYFKRATGKALSDYINDLRIGNACALLIESEKPVNEIAYAVGFNNLTYFNRTFIRKKKMTPRQLRREIRVIGPVS
jgi:AraC-like DNA-binding protein/mannose-6-phosphate isomerase-like protein (cupin superfamily)